MPEWLEKLKAKPWIAHLFRMQERFTERLGNQFAAAVTYFSVLSLVPILSFAFAIAGLVLTVLRPDLLNSLIGLIRDQFQGNPAGGQLVGVIERSLSSWAAVGIISLLIFAYTGAGWIANLKSAIRAQMRSDFEAQEKKSNIVVETLINLGILLVLLVLVLLMFGLSATSTQFSGLIIDWLGLPEGLGTTLLLTLAPIPVQLLIGFGLFVFLYRVSAEQPLPWPTWARGAAAGSVGLTGLQLLATFLFGVFGGNAAVAVFGPVIVLMLVLNLFATLILMIAAWMATAQAEPSYRSPLAADVPDAPSEMVEPVPMVREAVAQQAMKVGLGTGYALGAATGVGLGAIIAGVTGWFVRTVRGR